MLRILFSVSLVTSIQLFLNVDASLAAEITWAGNSEISFRSYIKSDTRGRGESTRKWRGELSAEGVLSDTQSENISFAGRVFAETDSADPDANILAIGELHLKWADRDTETIIGYDTLSWNVVETVSPVDFINQRDLTSPNRNPGKLGQPLLGRKHYFDQSTFEVSYLPYFIMPRLAGDGARDGSGLDVDESEVRFSHALGKWLPNFGALFDFSEEDTKIGVVYGFVYGRNPGFLTRFSADGSVSLVPVFRAGHRFGGYVSQRLDTRGESTVKLEAAYVTDDTRIDGSSGDLVSTTFGFEQVLDPFVGGGVSITGIVEFAYDTRGENAPTPFARDLFVGVSADANDVEGSRFEAFIITDVKSGEFIFDASASRRVSDEVRLGVAARVFSNTSNDSRLRAVRDADSVSVFASYHF